MVVLVFYSCWEAYRSIDSEENDGGTEIGGFVSCVTGLFAHGQIGPPKVRLSSFSFSIFFLFVTVPHI